MTIEQRQYRGDKISKTGGQALEAVLAKDGYFKQLFEQSLMAIVVMCEGKIIDQNNAFTSLTGYNRTVISGWKENEFMKIIYPEDYELVLNKLNYMKKAHVGTSLHFIFRIVDSRGQIKWLETYASRIDFYGIGATMVTLLDRTLMKQTENRLKETEEILGSFMSQIPLATFIKDHGHRLVFTNQYMDDNFEFSQDRKHASRFCFDKDQEDEFYKADLEVLQGKIFKDVVETTDKQDENKYWQLTKFPIDQKDNPPLIGGIAQDITEMVESKLALDKLNSELEQKVRDRTSQLEDALEEYRFENDERRRTEEELLQTNEALVKAKKASDQKARQLHEINSKLKNSEKQLREANEAKDTFFSIIAHDLMNPMQSLMINSELLYKNHKRFDENQLLKVFSNLFQESNNLAGLLTNLLQWARTQTGRIAYVPKVFRIDVVIDEALRIYKGLLEKKQIKIVRRIDAELEVYADINMIRTIIRNLINNAIKFSDVAGSMEIGTGAGTDLVRVFVKDNGMGMNEKELQELFRIDIKRGAAGGKAQRGAGLGLALSREFLQINGGAMNVQSKKGIGSTFSFTLPRA